MELEKLELTEIAIKCDVDINQAKEITLGLNPFIEERELLIEEFATVSKLELTVENIPAFKTLRLKFQKNRTLGINNWHKTAKEIPLRMGQLIDAVKRSQIQINETHEEFLETAEKHFEIQEAKRLEALQIERVELLSKFVEDAHERNLSSMEDDVWNAYFTTKEKEYNDRIEAEKKAESERIEAEKAKIAEEKKIREENEKLKKEAEAKEKARLKELEKIRKAEAEKQKEHEDQLKKEREIREKEAEANAIAQAKINAEREAREKERDILIEAERKEKQRLLDIELAKKKAEKAAALAPDKDKLLSLSKRIMSIEMPELSSKEANKIMLNVVDLLSKVDSYISENVEKL